MPISHSDHQPYRPFTEREQWLQDCQYAELPDPFTAKPGFFLTQVVGESLNRRFAA